jgi:hypothetical protein
MGSPLGLFSLTMVSASPVPNTHDVTARLKQYLQDLCATRKAPFPWRNYLHPMDIVAMPIEQLLPEMLEVSTTCMDVKDILTQEPDILDNISKTLTTVLNGLAEQIEPIQLALLGGSAHSSYWSSPVVASAIVQTMEATLRQSQLQLV